MLRSKRAPVKYLDGGRPGSILDIVWIVKKLDLDSIKGATTRTVRDINRRIVLNLVRQRQPISRADLARDSGLQRSTISLIVEDLIADRWIAEGAVGNAPRGRKPIFLMLNPKRVGVIGITVRPGNTNIALAGADLNLIAQASVPSSGNSRQFTEQLCERVQTLIQEHRDITIEGIGVSLPGRVDPRTNILTFAPNLKWRDLDLKGPLEKATKLPVVQENAANACALAELWSGRHPDSVRDLIAVTVSEGIGVGIISNGQLLRGHSGGAGEFGHISLDENGPLCNCGNHGCWEVYASNMAAVNYYQQTAGGKQGGAGISFADFMALATKGDNRANQTLERMGRYLARGLAMLVHGFAPEIIVVVGDVTAVWDRIQPTIEAELKQLCHQFHIPRIVPTDPATQPRMQGAVLLVLQQYFAASDH
jgi:predicted NBD/HSP70 family sugar kinase